jgi:two-component system cell cycle sensor histidine kinase/response regulator CckA
MNLTLVQSPAASGTIIAFEIASDPYAITDANGAIVSCNRAMENLTGYSLSEIAGRIPTILQTDSKKIWHLLRGGETFSAEILDFRKDESMYHVHATMTPFTEGGRGLAGLLINYRPAATDARDAAAVASIAAKAGHNLNNLLTVVNGYCEVVLAAMDAESPLRLPITEIFKAGARGQDLARQLLALRPKN